ncbi:hypothetical protein WFZ85_08685 [Flavobacterium sp. j3]|uniref:DUF4369 domain-containing protein n=1 Tax=Flavobacterium aureirubrum TaxID=3133147 RepID=A0ABU9N4Q5_9FLAO
MTICRFVIALFFFTSFLCAQEIKLKKEIVYFNDSPTFSYIKKGMSNELQVFKLNTSEVIFTIVVDNNSTESKVDDFKKIIFSEQKTIISSKNFRNRNFEFLVDLMLKEKVIDLNGKVDTSNLKRFKEKYNDNSAYQMMR